MATPGWTAQVIDYLTNSEYRRTRWAVLAIVFVAAIRMNGRLKGAFMRFFVNGIFLPTTEVIRALYMPVFRSRFRDTCRFVNPATRTAAVVAHAALPPVPPHHIRCVAISDTHMRHGELPPLPPTDVLLHTGDILLQDRATPNVSIHNLSSFNRWLGSSAVRSATRVVIAGNHDRIIEKLGPEQTRHAMSNATYLEHSATFVPLRTAATNSADAQLQPQPQPQTPAVDEKSAASGVGSGVGIVVYGTPNSRRRASGNIAYQFPDGKANPYAELTHAFAAPTVDSPKIDVLLSHDQPLRHFTYRGGCAALREAVTRISPRYHVFGHVHDLYSVCFARYQSGDGLIGINASTVNSWLMPIHLPVVFDVPARHVAADEIKRLNSIKPTHQLE